MAGVAPGSCKHIEYLLDSPPNAVERRLIAAFGGAAFARDLDALAPVRAEWRQSAKALLYACEHGGEMPASSFYDDDGYAALESPLRSPL